MWPRVFSVGLTPEDVPRNSSPSSTAPTSPLMYEPTRQATATMSVNLHNPKLHAPASLDHLPCTSPTLASLHFDHIPSTLHQPSTIHAYHLFVMHFHRGSEAYPRARARHRRADAPVRIHLCLSQTSSNRHRQSSSRRHSDPESFSPLIGKV